MANTSILAAFERMWQHIVVALGNKANTSDLIEMEEFVNEKLSAMFAARIGEITLYANSWTGSGNLYSQIVSVAGVTENSQVDLTPSVEQLAIFYEKDLSFVTENEGGVVTVYVIGQKPENDYTIQVTMTEVAYE